eukprot:4668452-Ditylum_brightwellii.AAC.1
MPKPKCTSHCATKAVGTYAAILTGMANPQEVNNTINAGTNRQTFNASQNPICTSKCIAIALNFSAEDSTTSSPPITQPTNPTAITPMDIDQNSTASLLQDSLTTFQEEMKAENDATLATFRQEMKQQIDTQIKSI